jgi:hypothetical protein
MPFDVSLQEDLIADIVEIFPEQSTSEKPIAIVLGLPNTNAPAVILSRDARYGDLIVPQFFLTARNPRTLPDIGPLIGQNADGFMPLFHTIDSKRTKQILFCPFLFNRGLKSKDFIQKANELGNAIADSNLECAFQIIFTHLTISKDLVTVEPSDCPEAFDHT